MRFLRSRRDKEGSWLQLVEGSWSDRHGSCYEVSRDAGYHGSYSCSVRIRRPSGEAFSRPAVIKQVDDGTIIWGQKYVLDETNSNHDSLSWKNLRGYSGFSWQRMKSQAAAHKSADVHGGEDCRVHPAPPPPPPPEKTSQDTGHKGPTPQTGWTPTWPRRLAAEKVEEAPAELVATGATSDSGSSEALEAGDPVVVDIWGASHYAHVLEKLPNNRVRVAWDENDSAEEVLARDVKKVGEQVGAWWKKKDSHAGRGQWHSEAGGQWHSEAAENKTQAASKGNFFWRQKVPTPPPPPPAKPPDESYSDQQSAAPLLQAKEEPVLPLTGNVSLSVDNAPIYEGHVEEIDANTGSGKLCSRGAKADYKDDISVPGDLLTTCKAALKDSVCFAVQLNSAGQLEACSLMRLKAAGSNGLALAGTYKTASGNLAGTIECAEVQKLFGFDVQVSHEVADRGLFFSGQEVEFNARFVLMADLSGKLEATELRHCEHTFVQPMLNRNMEETPPTALVPVGASQPDEKEEMPARALAPFGGALLPEEGDVRLARRTDTPDAEPLPTKDEWRRKVELLLREEQVIHL